METLFPCALFCGLSLGNPCLGGSDFSFLASLLLDGADPCFCLSIFADFLDGHGDHACQCERPEEGQEEHDEAGLGIVLVVRGDDLQEADDRCGEGSDASHDEGDYGHRLKCDDHDQ